MRRRFALALVAVCALVLAACNGATTDQTDTATGTETPTPADDATPTGTDEEALERVTQAAANTAEEGTARFEIIVEAHGTGGGEGQQPVTVEGEEDFDAQQRRLTFVGPQGDLEVIVDDTTVYVQLPATEGDDWARVELEQMMSDDVGFGGPAGLPFQSPQDNLMVLQDAVTGAQQGDEEDVRGETSTRYDLTVDLEQAAQQSADDTANTFRAAVEQSGISQLDMQVWVDGEERINRVAYSLDLSQADVDELATELETEGVEADIEGEPTGEIQVIIDYFDFGADVAIEVPSDDNVIDIDEDEVRGSFEQSGATTTDDVSPTPDATPTEDAS
ncbi:MAG TPA: hypothetical protein VM307_14675 [Egibacteraceae bacterium]|nr:hypothetical protein [Egibacteraceae bacterium]